MDPLHKLKLRRMTPADLDPVVALDAALAGRTRRAYFERRLSAALRQPELHLQFVAQKDGVFRGHALARVLEGEFGRTQPGLRLEVISVDPAAQSRGIGRALHRALEDEARKRKIADFRTGAAWRDHAMLRFLDGVGYALAPNRVIECAVEGNALRAREASVASPSRDTADIRLLTAKDLDAIVRIDARAVGRDRRAYMQHALDEALRESGVRISLAARVGGVVAGFVMARADLGDFGRTEPVAVIDTLGVAPEYAHHGIGQALLSQLFLNLGALRIERVETVVASDNLSLLGFFYGTGFAPAQRLAFVKTLAAS